jgi:hypothetical protein
MVLLATVKEEVDSKLYALAVASSQIYFHMQRIRRIGSDIEEGLSFAKRRLSKTTSATLKSMSSTFQLYNRLASCWCITATSIRIIFVDPDHADHSCIYKRLRWAREDLL